MIDFGKDDPFLADDDANHTSINQKGAHSIHVDYEAKQFVTQDGQAIKQGDVITLDGTTGEVNGLNDK